MKQTALHTTDRNITLSPFRWTFTWRRPMPACMGLAIRPGLDARTLLKRSLNAREMGRRCYSVGLTVAIECERWFSGDASVDRAASCTFGRWLGGGLFCFWLQSWTDRFDKSSDILLIACCNLRRFWFCCWSAPIIASLCCSAQFHAAKFRHTTLKIIKNNIFFYVFNVLVIGSAIYNDHLFCLFICFLWHLTLLMSWPGNDNHQ